MILLSISLIFVLQSVFLITNIRHFIFNSSKSSSNRYVNNIKYFAFNLIYFSIKSSITRYFIFNISYLSIIYIFFKNIVFTTSLSLLKSQGALTDLLRSNFSTLLFKLFTLLGTFFNLSMSS